MDALYENYRREGASELFPDMSNPTDARNYRQSITRERKIDNLYSKALADLFESV